MLVLAAVLTQVVAAPPQVLFACRAPSNRYVIALDATLLQVVGSDDGTSGDTWLWYATHAEHLSFSGGALSRHATTGLGARGGGVADDGGCPPGDATINHALLKSLLARTRGLGTPLQLTGCDRTIARTLRSGTALISGVGFRFAASGWRDGHTLVGVGVAFDWSEDGSSQDRPLDALDLRGPCTVDQAATRELDAIFKRAD